MHFANNPGHYIKGEYCDSLLELPEYSHLNAQCGLPPQSVVLQELVDEYGVDGAKDAIIYAKMSAPFVFMSNFLLNHIKFFVDNLDACRELWTQIVWTSNEAFAGMGKEAACRHVVSSVATLARKNSVLGGMNAFFAVAGHFLRCLRAYAAKSPLDKKAFEKIVSSYEFCKSPEEFMYFSNMMWAGHNDFDIPNKGALVVGLKITNGCTIQCEFCSEQAPPNMEDWDMVSLEDLERREDLWRGVRHVGISGGEPSDHPQFVDICKFFVERNVRVSIATAGVRTMGQLEELLPLLKSGAVSAITLSLNDYNGLNGKRRGGRTAAFLVKHNIPFQIRCGIEDFSDVEGEGRWMHDDLGELGLFGGEFGSFNGVVGNSFYPEGGESRDPLVFSAMNNTYPAGNYGGVGSAEINAELAVRQVISQGMTPSSGICRFASPPVLRADGTVSPCDHAMEGGNSGVERLMKRWPKSVEELVGALESYRHRVMRIVHERADAQQVLPCYIHRGLGKRGN